MKLAVDPYGFDRRDFGSERKTQKMEKNAEKLAEVEELITKYREGLYTLRETYAAIAVAASDGWALIPDTDDAAELERMTGITQPLNSFMSHFHDAIDEKDASEILKGGRQYDRS